MDTLAAFNKTAGKAQGAKPDGKFYRGGPAFRDGGKSVLPAIHPAPLHYRALQSLRMEALGQKGSSDYDTSVKLSSEAVEDLQWWIHSLHHHNGRPIYSAEPTLVLESDASKKGWGAHCRENDISTGGSCMDSRRVTSTHQLTGTKSGLPSHSDICETFMPCSNFSQQPGGGCIHKSDGGGTHSLQLCKLAVEFWDWCMKHQITIHVEHLPGKLNACRLRVPPPIRLQ